MRQVAIDAASIPKDAKIASLEKNCADSEKLIAEARSEKMKQFEEMQNLQVTVIFECLATPVCVWVGGVTFVFFNNSAQGLWKYPLTKLAFK